MCVGGSAPKPVTIKGKGFTKQFRQKAKITQPKRKELKSLNREVRSSARVIEQFMAPSSGINRAQEALDTAQKGLQQRLRGIEYLAVQMANSKAYRQQQALMLATLQGPPPPDPAADAPRLGGTGDPPNWRETGRHGLTIPADSTGLAI